MCQVVGLKFWLLYWLVYVECHLFLICLLRDLNFIKLLVLWLLLSLTFCLIDFWGRHYKPLAEETVKESNIGLPIYHTSKDFFFLFFSFTKLLVVALQPSLYKRWSNTDLARISRLFLLKSWVLQFYGCKMQNGFSPQSYHC